jgi:FixJ family two-component response regulator
LKVSVKTVEAHRAQLMERLASTMWPAAVDTSGKQVARPNTEKVEANELR